MKGIRQLGKEYFLRELLGVLLFPFFFFVVAVLFVFLGLVEKEYKTVWSGVAIISLFAGIVNLSVTYLLVKGFKKRFRKM